MCSDRAVAVTAAMGMRFCGRSLHDLENWSTTMRIQVIYCEGGKSVMKSMPRSGHGLWGMGSGCNLQMARGLGHGTCCTADDEPSDCKCHAWPPVTFLQEQEGLIDPGVTSAPRGVCGIHYLSTENGWEVNLTSWGAWQSRIFSVGLGDLSMPTGSGKR